jgi:hypothetical protein
LGQTLQVDGVVREVIGVLPESFAFFDYPADIFYPLQPRRAAAVFPGFDGRAIALLRDGVTVADANADVGRMIPLLSSEYPSPPGFSVEDFELVPRLRPLKQSIVGDLSGTLWMLMATVAALLLIAYANVANLVLVRMEARQRDFAIHAALGASWGGVARVVLSEASRTPHPAQCRVRGATGTHSCSNRFGFLALYRVCGTARRGASDANSHDSRLVL